MRDLQDGDRFVQVLSRLKSVVVFSWSGLRPFVQEQEFWCQRERLRYQHAVVVRPKLREWRIDVVCQSDLLEFWWRHPCYSCQAPPGLLVDPSHQDDIRAPRRGIGSKRIDWGTYPICFLADFGSLPKALTEPWSGSSNPRISEQRCFPPPFSRPLPRTFSFFIFRLTSWRISLNRRRSRGFRC